MLGFEGKITETICRQRAKLQTHLSSTAGGDKVEYDTAAERPEAAG